MKKKSILDLLQVAFSPNVMKCVFMNYHTSHLSKNTYFLGFTNNCFGEIYQNSEKIP